MQFWCNFHGDKAPDHQPVPVCLSSFDIYLLPRVPHQIVGVAQIPMRVPGRPTWYTYPPGLNISLDVTAHLSRENFQSSPGKMGRSPFRPCSDLYCPCVIATIYFDLCSSPPPKEASPLCHFHECISNDFKTLLAQLLLCGNITNKLEQNLAFFSIFAEANKAQSLSTLFTNLLLCYCK